MPSIRIGLSTQFNLESEQVGIGTTNPTATLEVLGDIRAEGVAGDGGISTFREYQGFQQTQQGIANNIVIDNGTSGPFSSLAGDILITDETTISSGSTVEVGKTKTLTVTDRFSVPLGETNNRDAAPEAGTTRFNQDFGTLEFFDGVNWKTVNSYARGGAAGRGVFGGGADPAATKQSLMQYVNIQSTGNTLNFGDLVNDVESPGGCSSSTRGLFGGGRTPTLLNDINYITIASEGNAIDFGNLTQARIVYNAASSSTRGIFFSGYTTSNVNTIDYVEISTTGNALDFGDVKTLRRGGGSFSSPTRAIYAGGFGSPGYRNEIEFLTISSKGDMLDFGDMTNGSSGCNFSCSNATRGLIGGGANSASSINSIDFITIASTGSATDFGSLTEARRNGLGGASSSTRGVFAGGYTPTYVTTIDYVLIASSGNALNFGDISSFIRAGDGLSDSHGGLGGF